MLKCNLVEQVTRVSFRTESRHKVKGRPQAPTWYRPRAISAQFIAYELNARVEPCGTFVLTPNACMVFEVFFILS